VSNTSIDVVAYSGNNIHPLNFFKKFEYANKDHHDLIMQVIKDAQKNRTTLHTLCIDHEEYGFISLSFQCRQFQKKQPSKKILNIDYLFVSEPFRKKEISVFDNRKTSQMLVDVAISIANEIAQYVPVEFIAAEPAHDNIAPIYLDVGFEQLINKSNVLFLKL
jgi:hypothetical protein